VERLQERGIQVSMAARGNPYENAQAESFFKTLKSEEVYLKECRAIDEAQRHRDRFIAAVYNTTRLHSALGYRPPAECEWLLSKQLCESALVR
jgi:putative transposase